MRTMRIVILGAGPAGLYLAYLLKRRHPEHHIDVIEQNRADATFGFGVVFSDRALAFLEDDDLETYAALAPHLESWNDITLDHGGERIVIDGIGFAAIGRLQFLQLLQARAHGMGIEPNFEHPVASIDDFGDADLVVGADGVNSLIRRTLSQKFGATIGHLTNRFAWFGTTKHFDTLTQTFRQTALGHFNAHHYRYADTMSTFIVEVDAATFERAGLGAMDELESRQICEDVFGDVLDGHPLISNNSIWRQFPMVRNSRWSHGKYTLLGDALHTAHFSIGSGTRLAMEDAIALDKALAAHPDDVPSALQAYEAARRPIVEKLVAAADASGAWYEGFAAHMRLSPPDFAASYIMRSGRIDIERLRRISPLFVRAHEAALIGR